MLYLLVVPSLFTVVLRAEQTTAIR